MSLIALHITDIGLRTALAEQLEPAVFGPVIEGKDIGTTFAHDAVSLVLIDAAALDKKSAKVIADAQAKGGAKRIFLFGPTTPLLDGITVTESFSYPVRLGHVLARVQFYRQAVPRLNNMPVEFGPYRFEPANRQIVHIDSNMTIRLTEKETSLLDALVQSEQPVPRDALLAQVWGYGNQVDTHTLETHIYQLRRKLDPQETGINWLVNEQGSYRLNRSAKD